MSLASMERLPLLTLYLTDRCNSRCATCDYWRHGASDLDVDTVRELLPALSRLQTRTVLFSGGEPLLNPAWYEIASLLRAQGLSLWLLTSGLSLAKHATRVARVFDSVTVSLDGACAATYERIRGVDAFDVVCRGIRAAVAEGVAVGLRVTLQRDNYRELPSFVGLAESLDVRQVSFLAVDVANAQAFGRHGPPASAPALTAEDLPRFEALIDALERTQHECFDSGFIAESPAKLRRLLQYFAAVAGQGAYPAVRCNAPQVSAVLDAQRRVHPCFFIRGPATSRVNGASLDEALNAQGQRRVREAIQAGERSECLSCVCPLWRDPADAAALRLPIAAGSAAR